MAKYRQAKTPEEADLVPIDSPVQIILEENEVNTGDIEVDTAKVAKENEEQKKEVKKSEVLSEEIDVGALKKQIEALERAEKAANDRAELERQRAEEALRQRADFEARSTQYQAESSQAQYDAIINAIEATKAEAETAERDLEAAENNMDAKLKADAYRRMARAEANLTRLEDGRVAFEARMEEMRNQPRPQPQQAKPVDQFETAISALPENMKTWMRAHPEYMTDRRKNDKIQASHWDVVQEGHAFGSREYVESLERHLGLSERRGESDEDGEPVKQRAQIVTQAPPTRDVVSAETGKVKSTRIVLSPQQREHAKLAGVSEIDYARGIQELERRKKNGMYSERG